MRQVASKGYYSVVAHNENRARPIASCSQYGGCVATILNSVAHRAKSFGRDPTKLGRWAYVRVQGKQFARPTSDDQVCEASDASRSRFSRDLVVVSAYRPNPPGTGESTVWAQHRSFFRSQGRLREPREAFMVDLLRAITQWRDEGCEVILGVDANEDISSTKSSSFRQRLRDVGMEEAILQRYPGRTVATQHRNKRGTPIDGIFTTSGVAVQAGGYYNFDEFFSCDHRGLWIDIDLEKSLGGYKPQKTPYKPRKLTMLDTTAVRRYLQLVHKGYEEYSIPSRLASLHHQLQLNEGTMTATMGRHYNCLHHQMYVVRRKAEDKCRRVTNGLVPWSPKMQQFWDRQSLWKILLKGRKGCRVSSRKIRRLMKKVGIPDAWTKTTTELEAALCQDRKDYLEAKTHYAAKWRKDFLTVQAAKSKKKQWRSRKARDRFLRLRRMKQREEARRRRRAQGKGSTGGLHAIQVEERLPSGEVGLRTVSERSQVEQGCMQENCARYDQTRSPHMTPPMDAPLYQMFNGHDA
ncbi:unnamed protein product, partial [Cylindrotheca closterium]